MDLENLDDEKYPPKVTLSLIYNGYCDDYRNDFKNNSYSQDKKISKFIKYNNGDSARTFRESNTDLSENLSLSN
ncbi:11286_t:CDS:2, partial [Cetraspora pellucida]